MINEINCLILPKMFFFQIKLKYKNNFNQVNLLPETSILKIRETRANIIVFHS